MTEEIDQARARKAEIEEKLAFEIRRAVQGYRQQFGLHVSGISVSMIKTTTLEDREPTFEVDVVTLDVRL